MASVINTMLASLAGPVDDFLQAVPAMIKNNAENNIVGFIDAVLNDLIGFLIILLPPLFSPGCIYRR